MKTIAEIQAASTVELVAFYNANSGAKEIKKFADRKTAEKRCTALMETLAAEALEDADKPDFDAAVQRQNVFQSMVVAATKEPSPVLPKSKEKGPAKIPNLQLAILRRIATSDYTRLNGATPEKLDDIGPVWIKTTVDGARESAALRSMEKQGFVALEEPSDDACVTMTLVGFEVWKALKDDQGLEEAKVERSSNAAGVAASWSDSQVAEARLKRDGVTVEVDGVSKTYKSTREAFRQLRLPDSKHIRFRLKLKASKKETFELGGKKYNFSIA